jgi:hypothetical protein
MKGKLELREYNEWVVIYHPLRNKGISPFNHAVDVAYLQLCSEDVGWIEEMRNMFDNMEGRIKAEPDVEFEIIEHQKLDGVAKYAKLRNRKYE